MALWKSGELKTPLQFTQARTRASVGNTWKLPSVLQVEHCTQVGPPTGRGEENTGAWAAGQSSLVMFCLECMLLLAHIPFHSIPSVSKLNNGALALCSISSVSD